MSKTSEKSTGNIAAGKRVLAKFAGQNLARNLQAPFEISSLHAGGDSFTVAGSINGCPCQITVDTGSNISIVKPDTLKTEDLEQIKPVNSCLRTMTGERAPARGKCLLQLGIGVCRYHKNCGWQTFKMSVSLGLISYKHTMV